MRRLLVCLLALLATLLLQGYLPPLTHGDALLRELDDLRLHGLTSRFIDNTTIEIKDPSSGFTSVKSLREPSEAAIRAWADTHGVPILEIDPSLLDTNRWTGWYSFWTEVPLSNSEGRGLLLGDADRNGATEVYGFFKDFASDFEGRVYEVDSTGAVSLRHIYPMRGIAAHLVDSDRNGLLEAVLEFGDSSFFYEQAFLDSLPIIRRFAYARYVRPGTAIFTRTRITNLDNDSLTDFLYRGSEPDSTHPNGWQLYTYVGEFNPAIGNFQRVWRTQLWAPNGEFGIGGYDVGDYDGDGWMEFLASRLYGKVHVVENTGDNTFAQIWTDSLPFVNVFYQTSGDVDNDGKREFFVGATMSNGNWTTMFEADSSNHYSPKFLFHLLSGGTGDEPIYLTTYVDGNGGLELVILSGADLYVFKSNTDNAYYLWYLKREDRKDAVTFHDFNRDGRMDFIISKRQTDSLGRGRFYAHAYLATGVVAVHEVLPLPTRVSLLQNYPNPFNPATIIEYTLAEAASVVLKVYNIAGQSVTTLVDEQRPPGRHVIIWNASEYPSGVYFYRLQAGDRTFTRKMLLVR